MDDHRSAEALIDAALDRDIEASVAVEPSPEFVARVRTRVQCEREASWPAWPWAIAAAGAIVVVAALVVGLSRPSSPQETQAAPVAQHFSPPPRQDAPIPPSSSPALRQRGPETPALNQGSRALRKRAAGSKQRSGSGDEPELLIAAGEARALQQLFAGVRKGLIDLSSLQQVGAATAALQPPSEIAFEPITFEPIVPETNEGERQ